MIVAGVVSRTLRMLVAFGGGAIAAFGATRATFAALLEQPAELVLWVIVAVGGAAVLAAVLAAAIAQARRPRAQQS